MKPLSQLELLTAAILLSLGNWVLSMQPVGSLPVQVVQEMAPSIAATQRQVRVFFPIHPDSNTDFTRVRAVRRTTTQPAIARFAVEQLITGPTPSERQQGLRSAVRLTGNSNCGRDFTLSITNGTARLKFCRRVVSNGIGDDARTMTAITSTLQQFSTVDRVIVLDRNGDCLGDESGENLCL